MSTPRILALVVRIFTQLVKVVEKEITGVAPLESERALRQRLEERAVERVEDGADVLEPLSELSADVGGQPELGTDDYATRHTLMVRRILRK